MKSALVALGIALLVAPAAAQPPAPELFTDSPITLDVTRVNLLFTVTDKRGRFIANLGPEDFEIAENKIPQRILGFTAESDLPLRLAILVDTSNSIRDRFRFLQEAAIDFIKTTIRPGKDMAAVISFDTQPLLAADMTNDQSTLVRAVQTLRPGGGTVLYDAIYYASRDKLVTGEARDRYRRAMIVLSDGEDNLSRHTRGQALEMAHKADAVIYTISTNVSRQDTSGDKVLRYFAEETGGVSFFPFKAEDMARSFVNIANELRHQYNVLYRPEPMVADGKYHEVSIRVKAPGEHIVRARRGYYAPLGNP